MSARKVYFGEYDMPHEIEAAAHALYEAVQKCGYFTCSVDFCPSLNACGVRLTVKGNGKIKETINTELHECEWQRFEWVANDD